MRLRVAIGTALAALLTCQVAVAAVTPRHSKLQAERNLLRATRVLARWHVGLVSPHTGLLLQNTTATCSGAGTPDSGRYARFTCVLHHGTHSGSGRLLRAAKRRLRRAPPTDELTRRPCPKAE